MRFTTKEDIEAPVDAVFSMFTEFETFEKWAIRRGAKVRRVDPLVRSGVGMVWDVVFQMRGKTRQLTVEIVEYAPGVSLVARATSPGVLGRFELDLMALSRTRTRVRVDLDMKPQTLAARLVIQSMRLAKSNLTKRFKSRIAQYSTDVEERFKRAAKA